MKLTRRGERALAASAFAGVMILWLLSGLVSVSHKPSVSRDQCTYGDYLFANRIAAEQMKVAAHEHRGWDPRTFTVHLPCTSR